MRASEARQKWCHLSFGVAEQPGLREAGPWPCCTSNCMAWQAWAKAGETRSIETRTPIWPGWEEDPDAPKRPSWRTIRATEDHGECHALPARPE